MLKRFFVLLILATMAFFSCTKDTYTVSEEELADSIIESRTDTFPCFEFVFPVTFQLPDQSTVEVNSLEEAKILRDSVRGKLKLVYPVEIVNSNGETVVVSDHDQMHTILADCGIVPDKGKGGHKGHGGKGGHDGDKGKGGAFLFDNKCFQFVYPFSVKLEDSSIVQIGSAAEIKDLVKTASGRIELVFPVNVVNSAGETVAIASHDELKTLLDECRPGGKGKHGHPNDCFEIVFPVSLVFPDGTVKSYADKNLLGDVLKEWRKTNFSATSRPEFQFPIQVIKKGETEAVTINSKEELEELRKNC
jgi:hypothetical protein